MVVEKNIHLDHISLMKAHNISVSMTIPFRCSPQGIRLLFAGNPSESDGKKCGDLFEGYEEAAVAFSLFSAIKRSLTGSGVEDARSRVDNISCAAHGDNFVIYWNTQGTGSMLRKTIGVALKYLRPNTLYADYSYLIRMLGGKPNRDEFNHIAGKMIDGINSKVHFVAIGKIKPDTDFKTILGVAAGKYEKSAKVSGKAPEKHPGHADPPAKLVCDSAASAMIVYEYITRAAVPAFISGKVISIYAGNWGSKRESLKKKDRLTTWIASKIDRVDNGPVFSAYSASSQARSGAGADILSMAKKSDRYAIISKNL